MAATTELLKISRIMSLLRDVHVDFPATAIHCLLTVMAEEGITQMEVAQRINMPKSTCSRNMRLLSPRLGPEKEGMGLIELRVDPMDYRHKGAYLTPKGVDLREKIKELMK